jgi:hypothetical protein
MPTFTATTKEGVVDFLIESFSNDPRLSYVTDWINPADVDDPDEYPPGVEPEGHFACLYRSPEGAACAFGRCVTDEEIEYLPIEGKNANEAIEQIQEASESNFYLEIADGSWWNSIQKVHDAVCGLTEGTIINDGGHILSGKDIPRMLEKWRSLDYPHFSTYEDVIVKLA